MKSVFRYSLLGILALHSGIMPVQAQWVPAGIGGDIYSFAVSGTNLFAGTYQYGVFLSTNDGTTWTGVSAGLGSAPVHALAVVGTNLFAGPFGHGVFLSTNNGTSWTQTSLMNYSVSSFASNGTSLFAGTFDGGIFLSTNNGQTWTPVNAGLTNTSVYALAVSGTNLFAGTTGGVFLSTNNGTNWARAGLSIVYALAATGTNLFASTGANGGVFLSTNNGTTWTAVNTGLTVAVSAFAINGPNLFAGGGRIPGSVFLSTNNGTSWLEVSAGLPASTYVVMCFAVRGTNLFAGTRNGVWRRPLSEMTTSIETLSSDLPDHFSLSQNYPNPFNPATTIAFSLPSQSFASLKVFDALGRELSVLLSEELPPGTYSRQWNAEGLSSGVYFYRIQAGSFVQAKRMLLLQ